MLIAVLISALGTLLVLVFALFGADIETLEILYAASFLPIVLLALSGLLPPRANRARRNLRGILSPRTFLSPLPPERAETRAGP